MLTSLSHMFSAVWPFLLALGLLVIVHEWGHYIVAKLSGVWVETFSIGFGPKIIGFKKNNTDYRIAPIPLGGFVKLYGQDPLEEAEGDVVKAELIAKDPRAFHSKPFSRKAATIVAGPIMNLILAFLIMPLVFLLSPLQPKIMTEKPSVIGVIPGSAGEKFGLQTGDEILSFSGKTFSTWQDLRTEILLSPEKVTTIKIRRAGVESDVSVTVGVDADTSAGKKGDLGIDPLAFFDQDPVIGNVVDGKPAAQAGLQVGDRLISLNGQSLRYWRELPEAVQNSQGKPIEIIVDRGGEQKNISVTPILDSGTKAWVIGVNKQAEPGLYRRFGFTDAVGQGTQQTVKLIKLTFQVVGRLVTFDLSPSSLGGPIQIAKQTYKAAQTGFGDFLYLVAFLSVQLGVLNLLPIPVLDGGHLALMIVEKIRGKSISPKLRQILMNTGLVMLLSLMLFVTFNDLRTTLDWAGWIAKFKGLF